MNPKRNNDQANIRKFHHDSLIASSSESVKVVVRCRPFLEAEIKRKENWNCTIDKETNQISLIKDRKTHEMKTFKYDGVFDEYSTQ